jgi:prepilin-type N-terminal cleavage/methylation domain-containing protein
MRSYRHHGKTNLTLFSGFTLLELSIVLLVLSLVAGGALAIMTQEIRRNKQNELQTKMDAIQEAMIKFRRQNNRLPCPADATIALSEEKFGMEASNAGTCDGDPAANFNDTENTVGGVVPVKSLGLPDDYMFDPWGGRFSYVVDMRMTAPLAFTTYPVTSTTIGSITVLDVASNNRTTNAIAVLISHGNNGHGAYQLSGLRKSARSSNTDEQMNCYCDENATATTFDNIFIMRPHTGSTSSSTGSFDDVVRYWVRSQMFSPADIGMR